jgi:hypothetical protein
MSFTCVNTEKQLFQHLKAWLLNLVTRINLKRFKNIFKILIFYMKKLKIDKN